jgi:hypothetical protein
VPACHQRCGAAGLFTLQRSSDVKLGASPPCCSCAKAPRCSISRTPTVLRGLPFRSPMHRRPDQVPLPVACRTCAAVSAWREHGLHSLVSQLLQDCSKLLELSISHCSIAPHCSHCSAHCSTLLRLLRNSSAIAPIAPALLRIAPVGATWSNAIAPDCSTLLRNSSNSSGLLRSEQRGAMR